MKYTQIALALLIIVTHASYSMENNGKELIEKQDHSELTKSQAEDIYNRIGTQNKKKELEINNEKKHNELKDLAEKMQKIQEKKYWLELKYNALRVAIVGIGLFAIGSKIYAHYFDNTAHFNVCSQDNPLHCHTVTVKSGECCQTTIYEQLSRYFGSNETLIFARIK